MKQGGVSWNNSPKGKSGMKTRYKCSTCGRQYKQEHTKDAHENGCRTHNQKRGNEDANRNDNTLQRKRTQIPKRNKP